ncbi:hypothetical protein [Syntrophomonas wolfei]|jgi:hypothetical protein|nr:hypothetical protein [Syntrophomonas wolfei]
MIRNSSHKAAIINAVGAIARSNPPAIDFVIPEDKSRRGTHE